MLILQVKGTSTFFVLLDHVFLAIFIMEILFKWYHNFWGFWKSGWNVGFFFLLFY